jgi:SSS family solute:Na+ symporter
MNIDLLIVVGYFAAVMLVAVRARTRAAGSSVEDYFVSGRSLPWYSIAASTIATNIHAGHFLAVAGAAYAFGLAQANFEINAILGLLIAAFVFVPLYLKANVVTISQFFELKFGRVVGTAYSILFMILYGTLYVGSALFWGAYTVDAVFGSELTFLGASPEMRIFVLICVLGTFSAIYTFMGGLSAVVRTDLVQFLLLIGGGSVLLGIALSELGGFGALYGKAGEAMRLHLPNTHPKLPWLGIVTMLLLNLQYWGCNQVILQRALAARSLRDAQIGLLVGGTFKYLTAALIVLPGVALIGILGKEGALTDRDLAYPTLVNMIGTPGLKGIILCGLFASLMSTVDSIFNSVSTLWSVDIYKKFIRPKASDAQVIRAGRISIVVTLLVGIAMGAFFLAVKFKSPDIVLDAFFKELSYFIKIGFVMLICAAVFLKSPSRLLVGVTLVASIPLGVFFKAVAPDMPYLIRTGLLIVVTFAIVAVPTLFRNGWRLDDRLIRSSGRDVSWFGAALGVSLLVVHIIFH